MWATRFGHLDIVRFLVDHGADLSYSLEWTGNVLHYAAFFGETAIGAYLLTCGMDIESRDRPRDRTPLHVAGGQMKYEFGRMLIQNGANVNAKEVGGFTPLDSASLYAD